MMIEWLQVKLSSMLSIDLEGLIVDEFELIDFEVDWHM